MPPGPAKIDITSTIESTTTERGHISSKHNLFNKRITHRAIGNSLTQCINVSRMAKFCHVLYRFPRGTIVGMGVISSPVFYRIAIVGGTGYYSNVGGQVTAVSLSAKTDRIIFNLEGF